MNKTPIDNNLLHEILKEEEAEGQLTPEILDDIFIDNKISKTIERNVERELIRQEYILKYHKKKDNVSTLTRSGIQQFISLKNKEENTQNEEHILLTFPILKVPKKLLNIRNNEIELPHVADLPTERFFEPKQKEHKSNSYILIVLSVLIIVIGISNTSAIAIIGGAFLFVISILWSSQESLQNKANEKEYTTKLKEYKEEIALYFEKKNELAELQEIDKDPIRKREYLDKQEQLFYSTATKPENIAKEVKKGASEDFFYGYLQKYFPGKIHNDLCIKTEETNVMPYMPDFVYAHASKNFFIDIEIDEPYELIEHKPIHYRCTEDSTIDDSRDSFFLSCNWIVVRFSEEQIIKHPIACCYFIARNIADYFREYKYFSNFSYQDIHNGYPLPEFKVWDYEGSEVMAKQSSRENLLKTIGINFKPRPIKKDQQKKEIELDEDDLPF